MPDDDAFLRAILTNPDDELPRLVYADYLDERGDPRGEFIRVQCELARLPPDDRGRPRLEARERELLRAHKGEWSGDLADFAEHWHFARGFVEAVTLGAAAFLRRGAALLGRAPVRAVALRDAWEEMDKLAASPLLGRVRSLLLNGNHLNRVDVTALLSSPHLAGLEDLNLVYNQLDGSAAEELAKSPAVVGLRSLDLSNNAVGTEGARALAASPHLGRLERLTLRNAAVHADGARAIAESESLTSLTALDLSGNPLGNRGVRALVHATQLRRLQYLGLHSVVMKPRQRDELDGRFGPGVVRCG
jgi:uncharacterized protein (TIGR02996 family)